MRGHELNSSKVTTRNSGVYVVSFVRLRHTSTRWAVRTRRSLKEPETVHFLATVAERRVAVSRSFEVEVDEFLKVGSYNLKVAEFSVKRAYSHAKTYTYYIESLVTTKSKYMRETKEIFFLNKNLVGIHENDFIDVQRKQDIEEKNLISRRDEE